MKIFIIEQIKREEFESLKIVKDYIKGWHFFTKKDTLCKLQKPLIEAIYSYNKKMGAKEATLSNIRQMEEGTKVVICAHQPIIAAGPLYLFYKIITVIKIAQRLKEEGEKTIPIFWSASDDNDWEEISSIYLFEKGAPFKISMEVDEKNPFGCLFPKEKIEEFLHTLFECIKNRGEKEYVKELLLNPFEEAENFSQWCAGILLSLFSEWGLVIVDPFIKEIKENVRWIFEEEIKEPLCTTKLAMDEGKKLKKRGYKVKVHKKPHSCNFFIIEEGERLPLYYEDGNFYTKKNKYSRSDLLHLLSSNPLKFSPNVLLRPIIQDVLFRPCCAVVGPSEFAYYQQLPEVYKRYGMESPPLFLRLSATLIEPHIVKFLKEHRIMPSSFFFDEPEILSTLAQGISPLHDEAFMKACASINETFSILKNIEPTLSTYFDSKKASVEHFFEKMHKKMHVYIKRREEGLKSKIDMIKAYIKPFSLPQERVLSGIHFLARYGPSFLKELFSALPFDCIFHYYMGCNEG